MVHDAHDSIDEAILIAAAEDAGLPIAAVRRALALERLGEPPASGPLDRIAGPRLVLSDRELDGTIADSLRSVDDWLVVGHHLRRARSRPDAGEWERRDDLVGKVQLGVRSLTGEGQLGKLTIAGRAVAVDERRTVLRLAADRNGRGGRRSPVAARSPQSGRPLRSPVPSSSPRRWQRSPCRSRSSSGSPSPPPADATPAG